MKTLFTTSSLLLFSLASFSQQHSEKQIISNDIKASQLRYDDRSKAPLFIEWKNDAFITRANANASLQSILQMQANDHLQFLREESDAIGMNHLRYQQYYKNIKVVSGVYILHEKHGYIVSANGLFYDRLNMTTAPGISEVGALQSALSSVNAKIYKWEIPQEESFKRRLDKNELASWFPKGELVILPGVPGSKQHTPALCWKFDVYAQKPMARYDVYVDAQTGSVLLKENRICTLSVTGNGTTKYSGSQNFVTDSISAGNYILRDATRSAGVQTYNMQNGTIYGAAIDFTDVNNVWTSTVNQDDAALDAHWGAEKTFDYYLTVHGRTSIDNAGSPLISYVHYNTDYNNAFWNGSAVTYGDGNGTNFSPLTELDVCGHELSHGYTQYTSGLGYYDESGAINEAISDIFGKSVDFWVNPTTAVWKLASKCYTPGTSGDALRHMDNPNAGGQPDTYHGINWYSGPGDNGGVHINSGVMNYWYYLLVNGGSGINDNGYTYNVSGIGINKASKIVYRCNLNYLTPSAQYSDAAFCTLKSANDLYGSCSPEAIAVKNAWSAVGVMGLILNQNAIASVSGTSCAGGMIQLNASGGTNYTWLGPNTFSSNAQNPVINNAPVSANGNYSCIISNGTCVDSLTVSVALNGAPVVSASANTLICKGSSTLLNTSASACGAGGNYGTGMVAVSIPDYPAMGTTSSITISGATTASSIVSVTIDSVTHTWDADLDFKLIAPNGSAITLASGVGTSGHHFLHTVFSSSAITPIALGTAPFSGSFIPQQALSALSGSANGTWKLKVTDMAGQDVGSLWKWSIALSPNSISTYSWAPSQGFSQPFISNPSVSPAATTTYTVIVNDALGCSATAQLVVTVSNPAVSSSVIENVKCHGASTGAINIAVAGGAGNYSYLWSNSSTSRNQANLFAGSYTVTVTDSISCITKDTLIITEPPPLAIGITSTNANCGGNNGTATAIATGGVVPYFYLWSNSITTASINNQFPGIYTATVTDAKSCSVSNTVTIQNAGSNPPVPGSITGQAGACRNQSNVHYSVPLVTGAISYNWTAPLGTTYTLNGNEIVLNFGPGYVTKDLCVSVTTACGQSAQTCMSIPYLISAPGTPGTIAGNANPCANSTVTYSVTSVLRATSYTWTAPANASITAGQGTNTVEITFNGLFTIGNMTVNASNCWGASAIRTKSVHSKPNAPASISGVTNNLCGASGIVYSVANSTSGSTSYTWTVPSNATINNGQGTTAISVSFGSSPLSGNVCVTGNNTCGNSAAKCVAVTLLGAHPAAINGVSTVCAHQANVHFDVVTQPGVSYNWTVPPGSSIINGQGTGTVTVNWGTVAGNVGVIAQNACGNQTLRTKAIAINCRMENDNIASEIRLYPNPANDKATLLLSGILLPCEVSLTDVIGKNIFTKSVYEEESVLDLSLVAKGVYFVQIKNDKMKMTVRLVVE